MNVSTNSNYVFYTALTNCPL